MYIIKKPKCYNPNDDVYPLCRGKKGGNKVLSRCLFCNLYEDMLMEVDGEFYDVEGMDE